MNIPISKELWKLIGVCPYPGEAVLDDEEPKRQAHAKSTLDATVWLMTFHPERLPEWYARHDAGLELAAIEHRKQCRAERAEGGQ
jgi:hypothetical protein